MQGTSVGSICYSDNSEEVKGTYGLLARTRHGSAPSTRLALQAMLGLVRRLDRATLAALARKEDLAMGAHTVFSEVTLHSSSQRRLCTT
jgi:hypothetical protein